MADKPLPPKRYRGQPLCERCGTDETGRHFALCNEGYTHEESCAIYKYDGLCAECEAIVFAGVTL